jgi:hypothetical protein
MKHGALTALALVLLASAAHAQCIYSRTAYAVDSCRPLSSEKDTFSVGPSTPTDDLPGLEEAPTGPLDQLNCECTYILRNSNPLCDNEKTQNFSQNYPRDSVAPICPRGKSLCADLCPRQIP